MAAAIWSGGRASKVQTLVLIVLLPGKVRGPLTKSVLAAIAQAIMVKHPGRPVRTCSL